MPATALSQPAVTPAAHGKQHPLVVVTARRTAGVFALGALAFALLGYHPYAEDGGLYAAAVTAHADPSLYPHDRVWAIAHTQHSVFPTALGTLVRMLHVAPAPVLLLLQAVSLCGLLLAAMHLARTCFPEENAWSAGLVVAVCAGLPVAGTALYAVDPYVTARSLASPLLLLACSYALRGRWRRCLCCWLLSTGLHPLMALWGGLALLLVFAFRSTRSKRSICIIAMACFSLALLLSCLTAPTGAAARQVALTRTYWFPARWHAYEWFGAVAPPLLLIVFARRLHATGRGAYVVLARASVATTALATLLALCFAQPDRSNLLLASLQPLRALHLIFLAFLATLGPLFRQLVPERQRWCGLLLLGALGAGTVSMQRSLFAHTRHIEWTVATAGNDWQEAFLWCRTHTPQEARFALDADYANLPDEDTHSFRAIAQRSALPDGVKDAGVASVVPRLAPLWQAEVQPTRRLEQATDQQRQARLRPLGVEWIVLSTAAVTQLPCPFRNASAQVCRLRDDETPGPER